MKIVIYTAIFGDIDDVLHRPLNIPSDVECHAYVDNIHGPEKHPTGWDLMPAVWEHATNPRLRARRHKLLPHILYPNVDYTLWVDGCLTPKIDPHLLINRYLKKYDLCLFKHMQRDCVYDEGTACIKLKKDDPVIIHNLMQRYAIEGYPWERGLAETTAVLRRHTSEVQALNELWWQELRYNSVRDQLSFNYVAWKLGLNYSTFQGVRPECSYFDWREHR